MPNLGVHVKEQATATSSPAVAGSGIPYFVGTAPVHTAAKPARPGVPVLCTSWEEAVERLGYSDDWKQYTLCEAMYSHLKLYACQPVIFCNVLDAASMKKEAAAKACDVADHQVRLPFETLPDTVKASTGGESEVQTALVENEDYTLFFDGDALVLELLEDGSAYSQALEENQAAADEAERYVRDFAGALAKVPGAADEAEEAVSEFSAAERKMAELAKDSADKTVASFVGIGGYLAGSLGEVHNKYHEMYNAAYDSISGQMGLFESMSGAVSRYAKDSELSIDGIAYKTLGSVHYTDKLMASNRKYLQLYTFPAGIVLDVPEIQRENTLAGLPPWTNTSASAFV